MAHDEILQGSNGSGRNTIRPGIGKEATEAANNALGDTLTTTYPSMDAASDVWADKVDPIAAQFDTEIGSKYFSAPGGYRIGSAYSSGVICSERDVCSINIRLAGDVSGGILSGYIHTHPDNSRLSGSDLYVAYDFYKQIGMHQSAYVALPNSQIWTWSTRSWSENPGLSNWKSYDKYSRLAQ